MEIKDIWPGQANLQSGYSFKSPYTILSELAETASEVYRDKLTALVTATYEEKKDTGDRTNFSYSFYLVNPKKNIQYKIFSITVQDNGWFPCKITAYFNGPASNDNDFGTVKTEAELIVRLQALLNHAWAKWLINDLIS